MPMRATHDAAEHRTRLARRLPRCRPAAGLLGGTALVAALLSGGCAAINNQFAEDGPSRTLAYDSPSVADVRERYQQPQQRQRDCPPVAVAAQSGAVHHGPLYFEDPFEDKGHGRDDYRLGWEDGVALPYGFARYILNGAALPVSMAVTWPWTRMESDGEISEQLLGPDHDATPINALIWPEPAPAGE